MSHPAGMRGLKLSDIGVHLLSNEVASRRDAWIETWVEDREESPSVSRIPQGCVD